MNIGVDCDGVLTDMSEYIFHYGEKWFKRKPVDPNGCSTAEIFGCSEKEEFLFGIRYFFTYCRKWQPRRGAAAVIRKLANEGNSVYQITARKFVTQNDPLGAYSRHVYRKWLKEHHFHFKDIFYCSEKTAVRDKLRGCRKYSVDIMIDDRPDIALYLADHGIHVLLFDTAYNRGVVHENITRVMNWKDVYKKLSGLS
ncbi:MAG: hypothetical protein NC093_07450 [Alistipes sp.]|nr:hypothetical protein [Alistipes sp.]